MNTSTGGSVRFITEREVFDSCSPVQAVEAIETMLRSGFDPVDDPARSRVDMQHGQFLVMPAHFGRFAGVKVATVAPGNPARGLPRIQARYLLFDAETLTLQAELDGTALTTLRTPAVSIAAVRGAFGRFKPDVELVVFGAGPQAFGHVETIAACLNPDQRIIRVTCVVRAPHRVVVPESYAGFTRVLAAADESLVNEALSSADVVVCATTATTPVFDSRRVPHDAVVIAVGSHDPDAREVDSELCARSLVIVETIETALRECGDVLMAVEDGKLAVEDVLTIKSVVTGGLPDHDGPVFFKSAGMSWQDLAVASTVVDAQLG